MKNKLILLPFAVFVFSSVVSAATVYQATTQNGVVYFGDTPVTNGAIVQLNTPQTYANALPPSAAKPLDALPKKDPVSVNKFSYQDFYMVKPRERETIRSHHGDVTAEIIVKPALQGGDKIIYRLDNKIIDQADNATSVRIKNIVRGEHKLQAQVMTKDNQLIMQTKIITFYMQRPHVLYSHKTEKAKHHA